MRTSAPELLPIFRSRLQGQLLATLLLHPEQETTLTALAAQLQAPVATVQREADRLIAAGILTERRIGRARLVRADVDAPLYEPLARLLAATFGPIAVVGEEFAALDAPAVYLFGSWAARYAGVPGHQPNDIDVLVVTGHDIDRDAVYDAAERAQRRIGRPVNPTVVSTTRWNDATDPLVRQIRSQPLVPAVAPLPATGQRKSA